MAHVRAVIYVRISQDTTGEHLGVDRQREDCLALAERRGWQVLEVFTENDTSAAGKRKRPEWERMMKLIQAGGVEVVIGWAMDRVLRSGRDRLRILETGKEHKLMISFARGSDIDLSTPSGRLQADTLGAVAQHEIEAKSDRQIRANAQAAALGRRAGGRRPFGYEQDGETPVPAEGDAIRDAYRAFISGGTLAGIARTWNGAGLRSAQANDKEGATVQWRSTTVAGVLRNPRYAALRAYTPVGGEREIVGPAKWPAIVPEETWRAAQVILDDPSRKQVRGGRRLLSGIATCGVCGEFVHGGGAGHGKPVYRCRTMKHFNRLAGPVDEYVGVVVVARLSRPDAAELLVDDTRPDVAQLRQEAHALRVRLDGLSREFADDVLTASQLRTITIRLRERIKDLEAQVADAGRVDVLGPLVSAEDVGQVWSGLDVDRQRVVVGALMRVRLLPVGRGYRDFRPETVQIDGLSY